MVQHPSEYNLSGYIEIQNPPERFSIINRKALVDLLGFKDDQHFQQVHYEWVESELRNGSVMKDSLWSESVAVGNDSFVKEIQQQLGGRVQGRSIVAHNGTTVLKEPQPPYNTLFAAKKDLLSLENTYFLQTNL